MSGRLHDPFLLIFSLPLPPSVNAIWSIGRKGLYKSAKYKDWQARAAKAIYAVPCPPAIPGKYDLEIMVAPDIRADCDNIVKAASDILQHCGIVANDKNMHELHVLRGDVPADRCTVTIHEH